MKKKVFNKALDPQIKAKKAGSGIVSYHDVVYNGSNAKAILPHNLVEVSKDWLANNGFNNNEPVLCLCSRTGNIYECRVVSKPDIEGNACRLSAVISEEFEAEAGDTMTVVKIKTKTIAKAITQKVNSVHSECVSLSVNDYAFIDKNYAQYQIIHTATGSVYTVNTDKIVCSEDTPDGAMRLSMYQRKLLGQQAPILVKRAVFNDILSNEALAEQEKDQIKSLYADEKICANLNYAESDTVKKILSKTNYFDMMIIPVFESYKNNYTSRKNHNGFLLRKMIGYSDVVLKTGRPYSTDESRRIIRLSRENLNLLGLDDMDKVVIRYRDKSVTVRAMGMDSMDEVKGNNVIGDDSDINMLVGIPVFIRKELGIRDLNATVKVERNTQFLYRKNLNIQFLPMIALLFTLVQTFQDKFETWKDYVFIVAIFILISPFVLYMVFSELRNKTQ